MGDVMALLWGLSNRTPRLARSTPEQRPFHWIDKVGYIRYIRYIVQIAFFILHHTGLMP